MARVAIAGLGGVGCIALGVYWTREERANQFTLEANSHVMEGRQLYLAGDFPRAEQQFARAIAVQKATDSAGTPAKGTAALMAHVLHGDACKAQSKCDAAERSYLQAMKTAGGAAPDALSPALKLAHLYEEDMKRSDDARGILNRRVEIATRVFGGDAQQTLTCIEDLAGFEARSGNHIVSVHLYQGLLKKLPRSHEQVPTILSHVVSSYMALDKLDDAERAARHAIALCGRDKGDFVALAHHNLGQVLEMKHQFQASDDAFETALGAAESPAVVDVVRESLRQRHSPEL